MHRGREDALFSGSSITSHLESRAVHAITVSETRERERESDPERTRTRGEIKNRQGVNCELERAIDMDLIKIQSLEVYRTCSAWSVSIYT